MSVRVRCPQCNLIHGVVERLLGQVVRCPDCDAPIQIPSRSDYEAAKERREAQRSGLRHANLTSTTTSPLGPGITSGVKVSPTIVAPTAPKSNAVEEEVEEPPLGKPKNRDTTEMDMTPMIDVTFLLLIFFVVTASFQIQKAMEIPKSKSDAPSANSEVEEQVESVTVQIDANNTFMVLASEWEREVPGKQNLIAALREAREIEGLDTPMQLIVKAHIDSKHRAVVDVLDAGAELQFSSLKLEEVEEFD